MFGKKNENKEEKKPFFHLVPLHFRIHKRDNRKHEVIIGGKMIRSMPIWSTRIAPQVGIRRI